MDEAHFFPPLKGLIAFALKIVLPPSPAKIRNKRKSNLLKKVPGMIKTKAFSPKIEAVADTTCQSLLTFGLAYSSAKAFSFLFGGTITSNLFPAVVYEKSGRGQLVYMSILALLVWRKCLQQLELNLFEDTFGVRKRS